MSCTYNIIKIGEDRLDSGDWCEPFLSNHFLSKLLGHFFRAIEVFIYFQFFSKHWNAKPSKYVALFYIYNLWKYFLFFLLFHFILETKRTRGKFGKTVARSQRQKKTWKFSIVSIFYRGQNTWKASHSNVWKKIWKNIEITKMCAK